MPFFALRAAPAETCTTQSQMQPAERDTLAGAARSLALKIQAADLAGVRANTIAEFASSFDGIGNTISSTAPHLKSGTPVVEQVYLLDASANKRNPDGSSPDAQFDCTLNKSAAEADFTIASLPPGRYAFTLVRFTGESPWLVSFLLRQQTPASPWQLAGLYPKAATVAGHDGLWYWTQARSLSAAKQPWNAFLYFGQARQLLQPAPFVSSTHLEALRTETASAAPPALANGIGPDNPLVIKAADGAEYRFTSLYPDNTLDKEKPDVAAHIKVDSLGDANTARARNLAAMSALLAAHPELRTAFHGVWIFSDAPGQAPVANEAAMNEIH
ncbi:hypothetical protein FTO74_12365 [Granulicella sp. WH15]|nr:hypothetical protein FTO74_12365 [Granulicella sp. WH15]